jgi:hypothetical protein
MANEDQLTILKQGVEAWNQWRTENPDVKIDLAGANLKGAKLWQANPFRQVQAWAPKDVGRPDDPAYERERQDRHAVHGRQTL